jgi:hypothetical protein
MVVYNLAMELGLWKKYYSYYLVWFLLNP